MSFRDPFLKPVYDRVWAGFHIAEFPALTIMVYLRKGIGYRALSAWRVGFMGILLLVLGYPFAPGAFSMHPPGSYGPPGALAGPGYLGVFACLMMIMAGRQRKARKKSFEAGVKQHSYFRGYSVLSFLPIRQSFLQRFVEPVLVVGLGFLFWNTVSHALGLWLIVSGISLRAVEGFLYEWHFEQNMDAVDAAVDSEVMSSNMQYFENPPDRPESGGAPPEIVRSTLSPDVEALMARRKKSGKPKN